MHHIGSQENEVEPEEQEETPVQGLSEELEPEEELQECPDHRPSNFERGKLQSIISLPNFLTNLLCYIMIVCFVALSYRNCLISLMHIYFLDYHLSTCLVLSSVGPESMLSWLRAVEVG